MYFFDLDGTMLDSNGAWAQIDAAFLGRFGVKQVPEDYSDYVTHHSFPDAARYTRERYGLSMTEEEIMTCWRQMAAEAYAGQLPLKPGVRDFLTRAERAGIRCAVLTSCIPELCASALESHRLTGFFERVLTTVELGMDKRDSRIYQKAAQLCGVEPDKCVFFEDSPVNCAAAKKAGWQVYGVADPFFAQRAGELRKICGGGRYPFSFLSPLPQCPDMKKVLRENALF